MNADNDKPPPDEGGTSPDDRLSFKELLVIILSGHIGVRKREQRVRDFSRANGLHVFLAAAFYFALIIIGLVMLVNYIAGS